LRAVLIHRSDPTSDPAYFAALNRAQEKCMDAATRAESDTGVQFVDSATVLACGERVNTQMRRQYVANHWNAPTFALAAAIGTRLRESRLDSQRSTGFGSTFATGASADWVVVLANFRWNVAHKARFSSLPGADEQ
jgi:hypothetical protein